MAMASGPSVSRMLRILSATVWIAVCQSLRWPFTMGNNRRLSWPNVSNKWVPLMQRRPKLAGCSRLPCRSLSCGPAAPWRTTSTPQPTPQYGQVVCSNRLLLWGFAVGGNEVIASPGCYSSINTRCASTRTG